MADVTFLPAAEADYRAALAWYGARSARAAAGFEAAVAEGVQRIGADPVLYGLIDDRHRRHPLRRYPYSLIYREEPRSVLVVAAAHSRRSSSFWRGRG